MNRDEAAKLWYERYQNEYHAYDRGKIKEVSKMLTASGLHGNDRLVVIVNVLIALEREGD